jgi:hypothetical protein
MVTGDNYKEFICLSTRNVEAEDGVTEDDKWRYELLANVLCQFTETKIYEETLAKLVNGVSLHRE